MIRWCCFCQSFMGESAPFDDFSWTDGICGSCKAFRKVQTSEFSPDFERKCAFFQDLRSKAVQGETLNPKVILAEATRLGISPSDVMMGVFQPILNELGLLFAQGVITTAEEHRFSAFVEKVLCHFEMETTPENPCLRDRVVLASCDQNYHTIGLRMLALRVQLKGIGVRCITPSVPVSDLVKVCRAVRPAVLGVSLFDEKQLGYLRNMLAALDSDRPGLIMAGGYLFKVKSSVIDPSIWIASTRSIEEVVAKIVAACSGASGSPAA